MGFLDFLIPGKGKTKFKGVQDPKWVRSAKGGFQRLTYVDLDSPTLKGPGVVVIWNGGVKPTWLAVKAGASMKSIVLDYGNDSEVAEYEKHGGVFVTWSPIQKDFQNGVVRYLIKTMKPELTPREPAGKDYVAVYHPGAAPSDSAGPKSAGLMD